MNRIFLEKTTQYLRFQRNILSALCFLLSLALVLACAFLFLKKERIIVVPPTIEKEFWIEADKVSPTYLEQYGCFLGQLLLGKSAQSAPSQRTILMRHADPMFAETLKRKLLEEEQLLQKQNTSYTFFPVSIQVNAKTNEVLIDGDRVCYASGKQVSCERDGYILNFRYIGSRLLLSGIKSQKRGESCAR